MTFKRSPDEGLCSGGRSCGWLEIGAIAALLLLANVGSLSSRMLVFQADRVLAGEWWRAFTYPLVHVSAYHLALDGLAFFFLYTALPFRRLSTRLEVVAVVTLTSLGYTWAVSPVVSSVGLCGLSGPAHGLMAFACLASASDIKIPWRSRWLAGLTLLGVVAKCAFELKTGQLAWAGFHLGNLGTPVVACHAGGVLGGLLVWLAHRCFGHREMAEKMGSVAS